MKPFNLKEALAGKPVCTRAGHKVLQVVWLSQARSDRRVVAVVNCQIGPRFYTEERFFSEAGLYYAIPTDADLMMVGETIKVFRNTWRSPYIGSSYWSTEKTARAELDMRSNAQWLERAVPVTFEV